MIINRSNRFKRAFKKMPTFIQEDFIDKIKIFASNPQDSRLKTHKLRGKLEECYAFNLKNGFRVFFDFTGANQINLFYIGPHDHYQRLET
jgi:mRNA-degrading endonuclease YafQ of YafQ-DinJ toxin-antitoxin module